MVRSACLVASLCVLATACDGDDAIPHDSRFAAVDAGKGEQPDDAALAPQQRVEADAGTAELDSAVEPLADAAAPDAGAVVDAGRVVPNVTADQIYSKQLLTCTDCHLSATRAVLPYLDTPGYARLSAGRGDNTSTCDGMPYVVPGHPEQSYLYLALTAQSPCEMHAAVDGFGKAQLQLLSDWIAGGAR